MVASSDLLMDRLERARDWGLPDWWIVSGAVYNLVWNRLTGRPDAHGMKDIDLAYFDPDTSWEAEDRVIAEGRRRFLALPPVEIRNQARVHLWFGARFGLDYPALTDSRAAISRYAARAHCLGVRLTDRLELHAPYGLADVFALRLAPNPVLDNRATYAEKTARQVALWPELSVAPWPDQLA